MLPFNPCCSIVTDRIVEAYKDNRLDAGLMRACGPGIKAYCAQSAVRAQDCLDVSPAALFGALLWCLAVQCSHRSQLCCVLVPTLRAFALGSGCIGGYASVCVGN